VPWHEITLELQIQNIEAKAAAFKKRTGGAIPLNELGE
jgi:hypothetical protein